MRPVPLAFTVKLENAIACLNDWIPVLEPQVRNSLRMCISGNIFHEGTTGLRTNMKYLSVQVFDGCMANDRVIGEDISSSYACKLYTTSIVADQGNTLNFNETFYAVKVLKRNSSSRLETDRSYDPDIKKLNEEIEKLEEIEKAALEKSGTWDFCDVWSQWSLSQVDPIACLRTIGPRQITASQKGLLSSSGKTSVTTMDTTDDQKDDKKDDKKDGKKPPPSIGFDSLDKPVEQFTGIHASGPPLILLKCETKLKENRSKLDTLLYKQEQSKNNQGRWNVLISRASALEAKMNHILPKLPSISKMPEAQVFLLPVFLSISRFPVPGSRFPLGPYQTCPRNVRQVKGDVDSYVTFLKGPTKNDDAERKKARAELALARGLYQLLDNALEDFITQ
ncbi:hypothetical protein DL96DRAFT_1788612 [Flagelloscypha sp. PMI_526]|nr:hypothetical protein DL96DRAFT_1788612 [Flagelloscypha sp. PMI_526]